MTLKSSNISFHPHIPKSNNIRLFVVDFYIFLTDNMIFFVLLNEFSFLE